MSLKTMSVGLIHAEIVALVSALMAAAGMSIRAVAACEVWQGHLKNKRLGLRCRNGW